MEIEKIREVITKEVFGYFGRGDFKSGAKILRKLYLKEYNFLDDLETKRLILVNLSVAEYYSENLEGAKKYIKIIKKEVEENKNYIEDHTDMYCNILNYYIEFFENEITIEEQYEINKFNYKYYKKIGSNIHMNVSLINMCFIDKNYDIIIESIKALHNIKDNSISTIIKEILKKLEGESKEYYNIAIEFLNQEELCIV